MMTILIITNLPSYFREQRIKFGIFLGFTFGDFSTCKGNKNVQITVIMILANVRETDK